MNIERRSKLSQGLSYTIGNVLFRLFPHIVPGRFQNPSVRKRTPFVERTELRMPTEGIVPLEVCAR